MPRGPEGLAVGGSQGLWAAAALLSTQGVQVEHSAELRGIRYASSLLQEDSDYYRTLTPALQALVRAGGRLGLGGMEARSCALGGRGGSRGGGV